MNSDAEYPLEYSKEKYVMLRRSVFDAMQTRIDDLEVQLAAIADPKLVEKIDAWWHMEDKEVPALSAIIDELEDELAVVKESLTTAEATIDKLRDAIKGVGQFDVTGYCHMCDEYKMHNEECPHTVSALAAGGGE